MAYKKFEDMKVWQDARKMALSIYQLTGIDPFRKDFGLKDQIQRAGASVMANIAEGHERGSIKDFIKFLGYAKISVGEVRSHLYLALDLKYISQEQFNDRCEACTNISTQLPSLSNT